MKKQFVKTTDEWTAKYLREHGFVELEKEDNRWVFINSTDKFEYDSNKDLKIAFSDMLCV